MKLNVAALFFLGYSASADNLRANSPPRRYLQGPPSSSSTSSGTDHEVIFTIDCCGDVDEEDLLKVAQDAIDEINSSSSSSSSDTSIEDGQSVRLLKKDEKFLQFSCNTKDIKKDLESLESSSSSRRGRVRRLSANSGESTLKMVGFDVCDMRARCGAVSDEEAKALARSLPGGGSGSGSGSGSGDRTRRLASDEAEVTLVEPAC